MTKTKIHTTNYVNTFIEVAEDCPVLQSEKPMLKAGRTTIATMQYEMLTKHPYSVTSDELVFQLFAVKNELTESELVSERAHFFSKGQPCLRTSPLAKRYGFGIHFDTNGKIAIYGMETDEYQRFVTDDSVQKVKAMRSSKKT